MANLVMRIHCMLALFLLWMTDMVNWFSKQDDAASLLVQLKVAQEECARGHELYCVKERELNKLWVTNDESKNMSADKMHKLKNSSSPG